MLLCEPLTLTLSAADYFTGDAQVGKKKSLEKIPSAVLSKALNTLWKWPQKMPDLCSMLKIGSLLKTKDNGRF